MSFSTELLLIIFSFAITLQWTMSRSQGLIGSKPMIDRFEYWMPTHRKEYSNIHEKQKRFEIYQKNVEHIIAFNSRSGQTYQLTDNRFADMTLDEFRAGYHGYKASDDSRASAFIPGFMYENVIAPPKSIDWRKKGAVSRFVYYQGSCGSSWAFSTIAAVEGIVKIKSGKYVPLSVQQLLDCDSSNSGCGGGSMNTAFNYIKLSGGVANEWGFFYSGAQGACNETLYAQAVGASISGYQKVPPNNEKALMAAVANQPVSAAIDASGLDFMLYDGGIYDGKNCTDQLDHAITIVGYGEDNNGAKYWLVRNSWSPYWGESGYIRMKRGSSGPHGVCGIAKAASYPIK